MNAVKSSARTGLALVSGALLMLVACAEPEIILPGEREDIRDPALTGVVSPVDQVNQSRAIRLPAQSSNRDWAQSFGTERFRVGNAALRAQPQLIWSTTIGAGDSKRQRIIADPVVAGGRVYTLDANAQVAAVSTGGGLLWTRDLTPQRDRAGDATGGGLAVDGGTLYVSLGYGELAALDAATGAVRWRQQLDATGSGQPLVVDGIVYLVAGDDTGWAIEAKTGRIAWQTSATPSVANVLGAPAPAVTGSLAIFAFGSGDLISTFRKGGLRRWTASVAGKRTGRVASRISDVTGAPVIVGKTVFAGNHSGRLAAFDTGNGDRLWTAREGALGPVWPAGGSIFAVTDRRQLARFDASSGDMIWAVDLPGFVKDKPRRRAETYAHYGPILAGGRLIVASNDGQIRSFSPESGALIGTVAVPDGATTAPAIADGTLYVVSTKGQLHAFR